MSSPSSTSERANELADAALDHPPGAAILCGPGGAPAVVAPTSHPYGALVGLTSPPNIDAVAACHDAVLRVGGRRRHVRLGVAVLRSGGTAARFRDGSGPSRPLDRLLGPLVDVGRRALGLATPPCGRSPVELLDAAFAAGVLGQILESDLGLRRPRWIELSARHPLSRSHAVTPDELLRRRLEVAAVPWSWVRSQIIGHRGPVDNDLPPSIARWLDEGSLARWLLASYPEPAQLIDDLCELLDPPTARDLRAAHSPGPIRGRTPSGPPPGPPTRTRLT